MPARGQSLFVTSATVQNPGDSGQICVMFSSGGKQVAGTQNDLVWDGNCATLTDPPPCAVAGSHGKQLAKALLTTDFSFRGIVLSFNDTNPIPDGPLYCCSFESEANPGECCSITITNTLGSEPGGGQVTLSGNAGQICTAASSGQGGGAIGNMNPGMNPPSASNAAPAGATGSSAPAAAPAAPAAGAPAPAVQVLPGGGARVENAAAAAPPTQAPTEPAQGQPNAGAPPTKAPVVAAGAVQPPSAPVAAVGAAMLPPTSAPIAAVTGAPTNRPTPADTPTAEAPVVPTAAPSKAAAKPQAAAPPAERASGTGLFGCQIAGGTGGVPLVGLGVLALVGAALRSRRRTTRRKADARTQR